MFPLTSTKTFTKFTTRKYLKEVEIARNSNYRYQESKKFAINIEQTIQVDIIISTSLFSIIFALKRRNVLK